jgi:hypothetical protein
MVEYLGKRARQPSKWLGCEGDHLCIDCPHREDRVRNVHNIQEETKVQEVVGNIPKIYAALENQWEDHHSNMIEVEGKIYKQPVTILIDS